jgi:hypothetical protein
VVTGHRGAPFLGPINIIIQIDISIIAWWGEILIIDYLSWNTARVSRHPQRPLQHRIRFNLRKYINNKYSYSDANNDHGGLSKFHHFKLQMIDNARTGNIHHGPNHGESHP